MIELEPGTILEKTYKGRDIKVKVVKDKENEGKVKYAFDGKIYAKRGALMKAILKGKVGQFTNFFGLAKESENGDGEEKVTKSSKKSTATSSATVEEGTIEGIIRRIVREEMKKSFQEFDL